MRSYTLDEVCRSDLGKIRGYLDQRTVRSSLENLYWLDMPAGILEGVHLEHRECQPYCTAVEVGDGFVKFELLIRSRMNHRCRCARYAERAQREFVIAFAEEMVHQLGIRT